MYWEPHVKAKRLIQAFFVGMLFCVLPLPAEDVAIFQELFQQQRALAERSLREEVDAMAEKYVQSLRKLEEPILESGDLDLVLALKKALAEFEQDLPTVQGAPLSEYAPFQRMQDTWVRLYQQWQVKRAVKLTELVQQYDRMLESQQVKATQTDQIDLALSIRAERERLQTDEELINLRELATSPEKAQPPSGPVGGQVPILASLQPQTVLFYTFDRDEREKVTDRSPARNHGKLTAAEWVQQGKRGGGMRFARDNAQIVIENNESLQLTGDLTISFWMYAEEFGDRRNPLNKSFGGEYTMTMELDGKLTFYHGIAGRNAHPYQGVQTDAKIPKDTWVHVCLVRSLSEKTVTWYFNGKRVAREGYEYPENKAAGSAVTLGRGYAGPFRGVLDDFVMLKVALPEASVLRLYQSLGGR